MGERRSAARHEDRPGGAPTGTQEERSMNMPPTGHGRFCWVDLASRDASRAIKFYTSLFGWEAHEAHIGAGRYHRLRCHGADVATLYQLDRRQVREGAPSHWTPYASVARLDDATRVAASLGGRVLVRSFEVPGLARVGLVMDPDGALFGLWEAADDSGGS
jgi:uncharacterized protein